MLKVKKTSSRKGGTGSVIMPSITSTSSGTPRLPRPMPIRLLRTLPISCVRSTAAPLPLPRIGTPPIQSFDAGGGVTALVQEAFQLR
ncbi:hypothetical protein D9M70_654160 [compost metagenome]